MAGFPSRVLSYVEFIVKYTTLLENCDCSKRKWLVKSVDIKMEGVLVNLILNSFSS